MVFPYNSQAIVVNDGTWFNQNADTSIVYTDIVYKDMDIVYKYILCEQ